MGVVNTPACDANTNECKFEWSVTETGTEGKSIWCNFKDPQLEMGSAPLKTYVVEAHADYVFKRWETANTETRFSGYCCSKDDCLNGKVCKGGSCVREEIELLAGETEKQAEIRTYIPLTADKPSTLLSEGTIDMTKMGNVNIKNQQKSYKDAVLTQDDINQYIGNNADKMSDSQKTVEKSLFDEGNKAGIDPAFAIAVAMYETRGGTNPDNVYSVCKNPFKLEYTNSIKYANSAGVGLVTIIECETNDVQKIASFGYVEDGIKIFYKTVSENCVSKGDDTIEKIAKSGCLKTIDDAEAWKNAVSRFRAAVQKVAIDRVAKSIEEQERSKISPASTPEDLSKAAFTEDNIDFSINLVTLPSFPSMTASREEKAKEWLKAMNNKFMCFKGSISKVTSYVNDISTFIFSDKDLKIRVWDQDRKLLGKNGNGWVNSWTNPEEGDALACTTPEKLLNKCFVAYAEWVCICGILKEKPYSYYLDVKATCPTS